MAKKKKTIDKEIQSEDTPIDPPENSSNLDIPTLDFTLSFSDITMLESDGKYNKVKEIMDNEKVGPHEWCVKTSLSISSGFGECYFVLDFYWDKRVYIIKYLHSPMGITSTDLGCLSKWCQDNGWKIPQPIEYIVKPNVSLWKELWSMLLVDSDYLDNRFGIRPSLDIRDNIEDIEEEE